MADCNSTISVTKIKLQQKRLNGEYTDATVICPDGTSFKVHKLILISATSYFERMFEGSFKEAKTNVAQVDFDSKTMETILDFVYLENSANILDQVDSLDQAETLLTASDMLNMPNMFKVCCNAAYNVTTVEDFSRVSSWHHLYDNEHTRKLLNDYVKRFWKEILKEDLYLECDVQQFKWLLEQSDTTHPYYEPKDTKLKLLKITNWIRVDPDNRKHHAASLISKLNHQHFPSRFVQRFLMVDEIVQTEYDELLQLFGDVL